MSELRSRWLLRRLLIAAVLVLVCSALALLGLFIVNPGRFAPRNVALSNRLLGTWAGEHGVVLDFRADGTARSRSIRHTSREFSYFEWTVAAKDLEVFQGARNHSLRWTINRHVIGRPTDRYALQFLAPDQLQLVDSKTGRTLRFTKTSDAELEAAP